MTPQLPNPPVTLFQSFVMTEIFRFAAITHALCSTPALIRRASATASPTRLEKRRERLLA
jgi:hypothetical protein